MARRSKLPMRLAWAVLAALPAATLAGPAAAGAAATVYRSPPGSFSREPTTAPPGELRVCADPNNMPFSNRKRQGFENKLAEIIAKGLHDKLSYYWRPQRRGFVRMTLYAGKCDVIMGTTASDMLATTRPYYTSTYVFVSRKDSDLTFSSLSAPELHHLKIGVQLIGDDGSNTPPAYVLGKENIVDNVVGYSVVGDYSQPSPPSAIVKAVERGDIDIAAVWGPLAGYFAKKSPVPLRLTPISDTAQYLPLIFRYPISIGVRQLDVPLRDRIDEVLFAKRDEIRKLLDSYGVPQL
ncbi:MAG TPA: quinoprotein dehydrogenase-associated putative ABC transporter substrate-binding protein [Pararhizobium sp.]|nr:quinoprotein dehydrogenase-associated putative ABC transporter substrate-binding protein [Pararhizobium sp.]